MNTRVFNAEAVAVKFLLRFSPNIYLSVCTQITYISSLNMILHQSRSTVHLSFPLHQSTLAFLFFGPIVIFFVTTHLLYPKPQSLFLTVIKLGPPCIYPLSGLWLKSNNTCWGPLINFSSLPSFIKILQQF